MKIGEKNGYKYNIKKKYCTMLGMQSFEIF